MRQEHAVDFGFGCMRLPLLKADEPDSFDYEAISKLFDAFLEKGFTYFALFNSIARTHRQLLKSGGLLPQHGAEARQSRRLHRLRPVRKGLPAASAGPEIPRRRRGEV